MQNPTIKTLSLTPLQYSVIIEKSTEAPFVGIYTETTKKGSYLCKNCGVALYRASNKFTSKCGWPSFDEEVLDSVTQVPDSDGRRVEIVCAQCKGHLGHVFYKEKFTPKNTRHCVNSVSLDFVENETIKQSDEVILAAGCFWGVEYLLKQLKGVLLTEVGYCGGPKAEPNYKEVCTGKTAHLEVVRVIYDPSILTLENLLKFFFEIHDPYQQDGQGPDIGSQYLSAIFTFNPAQGEVAKALINLLEKNNKKVATQIRKMAPFWIGEEYHRNYYEIKGTEPYCHMHTKRF